MFSSESPIAKDEAEKAIAKLLDEEGVDEIMLIKNGIVKLFKK